MTVKKFFQIYHPKRLKNMLFLSIAKIPMFPQWRSACLKLGGVDIKGNCWVYDDVLIDTVAPEHIHIGNHTTITNGVKIITHYIDPTMPDRVFRIGDVNIGCDVFLSCGVIICNSVTIGDGAIIGAGSIVTKDVPPYQVWAGNPAHFIKERAH